MALGPVRFFAVVCGAALAGAVFGYAPAQEPPSPAPPATPAGEQAPAGPAPHITFDATEVDLGDIVRGDDAVANFAYHNTGTAPLHILSAKPG
jgi:hypothetical protein